MSNLSNKPDSSNDIDFQQGSLGISTGVDTPSVQYSKSEPPSKPEHEYIEGIKLTLVLVAVGLVVFLVMLDMSIIVTAIPQITSDFQSLPDVGWYGSAYLLASCAFQPLAGKLYTYLSSKYTYLFFLGLFEFGSVLCGAAQSSKMLIVGRAVAGLGCSGISNGGITILNVSAPLHKQPMLLGLVFSVGQLGVIIGPLIGGVFTEYVTWRWCFYVNLPIGAVSAILLLLIHIPGNPVGADPSNRTIRGLIPKLDLSGFVLFASCAVTFLLALEWGGIEYAWSSATIIGLFCGSGALLLAFIVWEHKVGEGAMIPLSMVRRAVVWCSCMTAFFFFGAVMIFSYYLPIYFQVVRGVSPTMSGVYLIPTVGTQIITVGVAGALVSKFGYYLPWSIASGVIVSIASGLLSRLSPYSSTAEWVLYQMLLGIGRGLGFQIPFLAVQSSLPKQQIPIGMALIIFTQTFGGALFLTFAQTIFSHALLDGLHEHAPSVDAEMIVGVGATAVREVVSNREQLSGVLIAYSIAIACDFYLAVGAGAGMLIMCWGMGWGRVAKKGNDPRENSKGVSREDEEKIPNDHKIDP